MLKYSPYHNIKKQNYPNILVTAGLNDSRVSFWEPAKYVAKLRGFTLILFLNDFLSIWKMYFVLKLFPLATKTDNNLLLLRTYLTGHMGPSGTFGLINWIKL
jgi:oligopeptidase B